MNARRWPVVVSMVPGLVAFSVLAGASRLGLWSGFRVPPMGQSFGDLRQVTSTSECVINDPSWSLSSPTCDPFGRPFNYPSAVARFGAFLHIRASDTQTLGYVLIALFAVAIWALTAVTISDLARPVVPVATITVIAVSPPAVLAAERGNIDIVVFALVVAFAVCCVRRWSVAQVIVLPAAIALKFFPAGAVIALAIRQRHRLVKLAAVAALTGIIVVRDADELRQIVSRTPQTSELSFGASVIPMKAASTLGIDVPSSVTRLVGLAAFFGGCAGLQVLLRSSRRAAIPSIARIATACRRDTTATFLIAVGGGVFLLCYVLGTNFDYRLIFLGIAIAGLSRLTPVLHPANVVVIVLVALCFVTYPTGRLQYVGDVAWLLVAPYLATLLIRIIRTR